MSKVIISDPDATALWLVSRNGDVLWAGNVMPGQEIGVSGSFDTLTRNAVTAWTGDPQTGLYFNYNTTTAVPFSGYDGFTAFREGAYWLTPFLILWYIVRMVGRFLTNKNPSP